MNDQPTPGPEVNDSNFLEELPVEPLDPVMLAEVLEALARRLESLEVLVEAVTDRLVENPAGGPWSWRQLGPSRTRALLIELRNWVDWLIGRYELRGEAETIPPCWFLHPVAVEELTGLMVAWKSAYSQKETVPSDSLVNWHDRWLWPTLHRLNAQLHVWAKCAGGSHVPSRPTPPLTNDESFASFLVEAEPRTDTARPPHLVDALDEATMQAALSSGEAVALLPDDPWTPFRYRDHWYGVPDGLQDRLWRPVDEERAAQLDLMLARLSLVGSPGRGSP